MLALISCSPQHRLQRLIKKHPELVRIDTLSLHDTIRVSRLHVDTAFMLTHGPADTFYLHRDSITVRVIRNHDTLRLILNRPPDTLIHTIKVPVQKLVIQRARIPWPLILIISLVVAALLLFFARK